MSSWRRNNYLQQQLIFSNVPLSYVGGKPLLIGTEPLDYHNSSVVESIAIDPNEKMRYAIPREFNDDRFGPINLDRHFIESNLPPSSTAEHIMYNNTTIQQRHPPQYPSSLMSLYHSEPSEFQRMYQPQPSLPLSQQHIYASTSVQAVNQRNPTVPSMTELPSYPLSLGTNERIAYYKNPNKTDITNLTLITEGESHSESMSSTIPSSGNIIATPLPPPPPSSITPSSIGRTQINEMNITAINHERQSDNVNKMEFNCNDGRNYYSIKNANHIPLSHKMQKNEFLSMPSTIENNSETIMYATKSNLNSNESGDTQQMNEPAIIHTSHNQNQHLQNVTNIAMKLNEKHGEQNGNILNATAFNRNAENNEPLEKNAVNDGHVYEKQLADCKISGISSFDPNEIKNESTNSGATYITEKKYNSSMPSSINVENMNKYGSEMGFGEQTPFTVQMNSIQENNNRQFNENANYARHDYQPNELQHFENEANVMFKQMAGSHVDDAASSQLSDRRSDEKRRLSIDSRIPTKTCDDSELLAKKSIAANARRRYSMATNLHNLPQNFGSIEPFYSSSAYAIDRTQDANNLKVADSEANVEDVAVAKEEDDINRNKYENGNPNMFTNLENRRMIAANFEPNSVNLAQQPIAQSYLWQNDEIINSNDQRVYGSDVMSSQRLNIDNNTNKRQTSAIISDDAIEKDTNNINRNDDYIVEHTNIRPFRTNEISDDQTYIEKTMKNLHLIDNANDEHTDQFDTSQIDDGLNEKSRIQASHR